MKIFRGHCLLFDYYILKLLVTSHTVRLIFISPQLVPGLLLRLLNIHFRIIYLHLLLAAHNDSIWSAAWGRSDQDSLGAETIVTGSVDDLVKIWRW